MSLKQYKIESFRDILKRFKLPRFTAPVNFLNTAVESSKKSKTNFFFQVANFSILWLLILIILPDRSDQWLSLFDNFRWSFLPIGQIITASVFYIFAQTVFGLFDFSWRNLFETAPKITISITIVLTAFILALFNKLIFTFKERIKQDLILWRISK